METTTTNYILLKDLPNMSKGAIFTLNEETGYYDHHVNESVCYTYSLEELQAASEWFAPTDIEIENYESDGLQALLDELDSDDPLLLSVNECISTIDWLPMSFVAVIYSHINKKISEFAQ